MILSLGDLPLGLTVPFPFPSYDSNGASVTITGLAVTDIELYKGTSMTQRSSDNGFALLDTDGIDIDGRTGIHGFSVDFTDNSDSGFYAAGNFYYLVVDAVTIDSQTVRFIYWFSLGMNLRPTTAGRTLDVTATGAGGIDWGNVENPTTTLNLSGTTVKAVTDRVTANTDQFAGQTIACDGEVTIPGGSTLATTNNITAATVTLNASQPTITFAGLTITDALTINNGFIINAPSTTNRPGFQVTGNGTGEAFKLTSGATAKAVSILSLANHALFVKAIGSYKAGVHVESDVDGNGAVVQCSHDDLTTSTRYGHGIVFLSSTVNYGNAIYGEAIVHGAGFFGLGAESVAGMYLKGGSTNAPGFESIGGGTTGPGAIWRGAKNAPATRFVGGSGGTGDTASSVIFIENQNTTMGSHGIEVSTTSGDCLNLYAAGYRSSGVGSRAIHAYSDYGHTFFLDTNGSGAHGIFSNGGTGTGRGIMSNTFSVSSSVTLSGAVSLGSTLSVAGTTTLAAVGTSTVTMAALTVTNALTVGTNLLPWNAAWDPEVQSECTDALVAFDPATGTDTDAIYNIVNSGTHGNAALRTLILTVDTVVDASKVTTDRIETMIELDGSVYRYTTNALEQAPSGGGSAPTVAQIDAQLSSTHGAGAWGSSGSGTGANVVTVTVDNGLPDEPIERASVTATQAGVIRGRGITDAAGQVVLNLNDGTYDVAITADGFTFDGDTLVVSGASSGTYSMDALSITPSNPGQTTGFSRTYDDEGNLEAGVVVTCRLISLDEDTTGVIGTDTVRSATSNGSGLVQFTNLFLGATYEFMRRTDEDTDATGFVHTIPTDADATYELPPIIGNP